MPITRESFDGAFWPDEIVETVALACITGAKFARALTPLPISKQAASFPTASPTGFDWVAEGAPLPTIDMNDGAHIVGACKLAGLLSMSNESLSDSDQPVGDLLSAAVADAMGPKLDHGLLFGGGGDEPDGVLDVAPVAIGGADWRADVIGAWGELVDAGADPETIVAFSSASVIGWELSRTDDNGQPIHPDGSVAMVGPSIGMVAVPALSSGVTLVADVSRLYLVVRNDFEVAFDSSAAFASDSTLARLKGRFTIGCANPGKTLRKITAAS